MSTITTINGTDVISTSRTTINTNFSNLNTDKIETSYLDTDTTLAANSDTKIATQKATKAYVDANLAQNASTTAKGIVEEATQAEVTAGTATGGTGARLFVNPANALASTTDRGMVEEATQAEVDAGTAAGASGARLFINPSTQRTPFFQQMHSTNLTTEDPSSSLGMASASNSTGTILIVLESTDILKRYAKDTNTGMYYLTHTVNPAASLNGYKNHGLVVLGNYLYIIYDGGVNFASVRFNLADLTSETTMTVPTVTATGTNSVVAWTDGTYVYWVGSNVGTTTVNKWSVSGTTFSAVSTGTCPAVNGASDYWTSIYDGTNIYLVKYTSNTSYTVIKLADAIYTSATSNTTYLLPSIQFGSANGVCIAAVIDSNKMYIGNMFCIFNATAQYVVNWIISPYTKP